MLRTKVGAVLAWTRSVSRRLVSRESLEVRRAADAGAFNVESEIGSDSLSGAWVRETSRFAVSICASFGG